MDKPKEIIFLQAYDDDGTLLTQFDEAATWCEDEIEKSDVVYVRGDIVEEIIAAIAEWERAKEERYNWKPIPGQAPPPHLIDNAREANKLLTQAMRTYTALLTTACRPTLGYAASQMSDGSEPQSG